MSKYSLSYFNKNYFFSIKINELNFLIINSLTHLFSIICINNYISNFRYKITNIIVNTFILSNKIQSVKTLFSKYYFIGLGFKMFVYKKKLFVWVGLTHYTILNIPSKIFIRAKKKRIYITSTSLTLLKNFLVTIRYIKKRDIYKGKGLLEVKSYKGFTIMKTGKKKQY